MFSSFFKMGKNIGIDLGTVNTVICSEKDGIILREPSVVAIDKDNGRVVAVGNDANDMLGRTPDNIIAVRPLKEGVIADYEVAREMIRLFMMKTGKRSFIKPNVTVCVPSEVTNVEKKALESAVASAGAKKTVVIEKAMAAAIGAGVDVKKPMGHMLVDIGGGTAEAAVVSLSGLVAAKTVRGGGGAIDRAVASYIKHAYNVTIGIKTAEDVKKAIGSAMSYQDEGDYEIKGRDILSGLPKTISVTAEEVRTAMTEPIREIVSAIMYVLEHTPPELAGDILENGIVLTGGGALIRNIDKMIHAVTGLPVSAADEPIDCTALGMLGAGGDADILKRSLAAK